MPQHSSFTSQCQAAISCHLASRLFSNWEEIAEHKPLDGDLHFRLLWGFRDLIHLHRLFVIYARNAFQEDCFRLLSSGDQRPFMTFSYMSLFISAFYSCYICLSSLPLHSLRLHQKYLYPPNPSRRPLS